MSLIEGFGDEVLFCLVILILIGVLSLAWFSTDVHPVWNAGSIWLVQLQTHPNRRVLQVVSLDERQLDQVSENRNNLNDSETQHIIVEQTRVNSNETETVTRLDTNRANADENHANINSLSKESTASQASTSVETPTDVEPETNEVAPNTTIKLKFLDDTHRLVGAWLSQTVGQFKRQHFTTEVNQGKTIRLIYQGQLLRDDGRSLESYGLHDNCVLHCHIGIVPYTGGQSAGTAPTTTTVPQAAAAPIGGGRRLGNADVGQYVYLVFGVKFTLLWLAWFSYPQFFSTTSFISLILCTGLYFSFVYSARRRHPAQQQQPVNQTVN